MLNVLCICSNRVPRTAVATIIEHLLKWLKKEYPVLNQAFLRSDIAGCNKNGALLLSLHLQYKRRTL